MPFFATLRGQKDVAVAVLRGPSWSLAALRGQKEVAVAVLRDPSRPFADKKMLQLPFFVVLRGPSWTKRSCRCRSSWSFEALRGQKEVAVAVLRDPSRPFADKKMLQLPFLAPLRGQKVLPCLPTAHPQNNLSQPLTFCTTYCNNRTVPARRPLSSPCTVCSPAKEHRHVHVVLFHLPARTDLPPPAQDRRPPGDPHSCCRSILMPTKCSPCGRTLLHLRPARTGRPHRSLQRHRRTGLARQQQLAQPETILNLVRRYHRQQWLRHPPRPPE